MRLRSILKKTKKINLIGGKGLVNDPVGLKVGGLDFYLSYGSKFIDLPFSVKLNDFIANKIINNIGY